MKQENDSLSGSDILVTLL